MTPPPGVPTVDGIPYARAGRAELTAQVQALLDDGDVDAARVTLFADADDWWSQAPPPPEQLAQVVHASTLREAMDLLGMGRVGDYFAHRWSDPTYLAGLALLQQHWPGDRPVVEVACGVGHYLRELHRRGLRELTGVDVVWAKLWLAQRFVCPEATYLCADVTRYPPPDPQSRYVFCHDAFYFLHDKPAAAAALRAWAGPGGTVVVGHAHVTDPGGAPLAAREYAEIIGATWGYDDDELTTALLARRAPRPSPIEELEASEAAAFVVGNGRAPAPFDLGEPIPPLRRNPLYVHDVLRWPSERYAAEYGPRSTYLPPRWPAELPNDAARRRMLVDLPESW